MEEGVPSSQPANPLTQSLPKKKSKLRWVLWISIPVVILGICFVTFLIVVQGVYTGIHGTADPTIVAQIKLESSIAPRLYSWDTPFGRIYAHQCSGPPYAQSNSFISAADALVNIDLGSGTCGPSCFDGGTQFYNARGELITNCGYWDGSGDALICKWLDDFTIAEADYRDPDCLAQ